MIRNARKKAGMPTNKMGNDLRSYRNQSETVNNKLTRQKEAIRGKAKSKTDLTKLEFVRDVWEQVDQQQQLELQLAIFGLSEEYEPEEWEEFSRDIQSIYSLPGLTVGLVTTVVKEAETAELLQFH